MKGEITKVSKGADFKERLLRGVDLVGDAVGSTMGPWGRNVILERRVHLVPLVTNDGKRVAKAINPRDPVERMAVRAICDAAEATDFKCGDGTSGSIVLAQAIIHEAFKHIQDRNDALGIASKQNKSVVQLRKEINEAKEVILKELEKKKKKITSLEDLEKVAITSVEDESLGKIIANMVKKVGEDGHIFVEEGFNFETETEIIEGMKFWGKLAANFMVTDINRMEASLENPKIIVTNHTIRSMRDFIRQGGGSILGEVSQKERQIVLMGWKFEKDFLHEVANMWRKQGFHIFCVKVPAILTEQLKDIAIYCGTTVVDENLNMKLSDIQLSDLGDAKRLIANAEETILVGGKGKKADIQKRIKELKDQILVEKLPEFRKKIEQRIADLASGIGVIRVGHNTQLEQGYVIDKAQDAVLATKQAFRDGTVLGGGMALKQISEKLPKDCILKNPIQATYKKIQDNAGEPLKIPDSVIDPYNVIRAQVENACSVAGALISAGTGVFDEMDATLDSLKDEIGKFAGKLQGKEIPEDPALDR